MIFTSAIFLFWFLPICILLVYLVNQQYRNLILLAASLIFYSWGEPKFILVMLGSIAVNYGLGLWIEKRNRKTGLILAIAFNLLVLFVFKYANFVADNINILFEQEWIALGEITLPIGISFFTFQTMSYVVDVYRKEVAAQRSILDLALYISLFPQLIAGPIVRYRDINKQLKSRELTWPKFSSGVERFIIGFIKKVLIADNLAYVADSIFDLQSGQLDTSLAWIGIIAYSFQIYFDFSGYSDMAIGLGRMFGFEFLENFNYPYTSKSIREFWRRWHISLSTWFRDYLYIPLGGNRKGNNRTYFNLLLVFFLTGLWHGASWSFVIWGLYHGLFLITERVIKIGKVPKFLSHSYTLIVIVVGWVFFRANNLTQALTYLKNMFSFNTAIDFPNNVHYMVNKEIMIVSILAFLFSMPLRRKLKACLGSTQGAFYDTVNLSYYLLLVTLFVISITYMVADSYSPFIYFRF